ncbi:MAG: (2Fe-2S)-binding protein [Polaromonas sp.]|jgi:nicotinate dehydrogenase subunit A|nr:(2Fe-2S)-binding protein [Polaromonas sp.]
MALRTVKLTINGRLSSVEADDSTPLVYVLRDELGLKGTRLGCGQSQCGACHVMLDGVSVPACDTPLWAVENKVVVTIEGLGQPDALHALQQAFIDEQAAQCGYCVSGILVSAAALLAKRPQPSEAQIRDALDPHLCRCGAHNRMVRAVLKAAAAGAGT